ncbi:chorismate mutase [Pasteurellaceae bacterium 20609_3]|uniref:chorismate mutase n=1 Tax=Spirabiliibacterium mucosae TaxID=28156 RepID=UPI001AACBC02|nr:chorismate mutase [Spirabiliibacterium mucosae]MBE2897471.1 chorismate mutase [Spirabiliibacterium mucosae]
MTKPLSEIRQQITALDRQLLDILSQRHQLAFDVVKSKEETQKPLRDINREQQLLKDLVDYANEHNLGLDSDYIIAMFQRVIEDSVLTQQAYLQNKLNAAAQSAVKVAFLGVRGSYSNLAARRYAKRVQKQLAELSCDSFSEIFDKVNSGEADVGVLPLENTTSGAINEVYDLLQHTELAIVGELAYPIKHCVLVSQPTALSVIDTLYSHPQVLAQCSHFIRALDNVKTHYCESSSHAMQLVAQLNKPNIAALGNAEGGALYGLNVLHDHIANQPNNITRFIIISKSAVNVSPQVQSKTLLLMSTTQKAGALVDALLVFKNHGIQMTKLESRPIYGKPWEEMFYLEIIANIHNDSTQQALRELNAVCQYLKVLGCYPSDLVIPA